MPHRLPFARIVVKSANTNVGLFFAVVFSPTILPPGTNFQEEFMIQVNYGTIVKVRAYGGRILTRRCVGVKGERILICNEEEYQNAKRENRQPECVGFSLVDILDIEEKDVSDDVNQ
jgi:hypothetical protein